MKNKKGRILSVLFYAKNLQFYIIIALRDIMDKIKDFYCKKADLCNVAILLILVIFGWLFFKGHYSNILTDFGREMLYPQAMNNGNVLYKDILCIYFPLGYQFVAVMYKLFGTSIQTLEFCGLIVITLFVLTSYSIAGSFLNNTISLLLCTTILIASAFNGTLFNMILPYSVGFTLGITFSVIAIALTIKYFKNENIYLLYTAFVMCGAAFASKGELGLLILPLLYVSCFAKPCLIKQNIINIVCFLLFPVFSLASLMLQGLSIYEILNAAGFMRIFFSTKSMIFHIAKTGGLFSFSNIPVYINAIFNLAIFMFASYFLFSKTVDKKTQIVAIIFSAFLLNITTCWRHTMFLPILLLLCIIFFRKKLSKEIIFLTISAVILNLRMFWGLILSTYGFYTAPIAILTIIVLLKEFLPENKIFPTKDMFKKFVVYLLFAYCLFFAVFDVTERMKNNTKVSTEKGTLYLPKSQAEMLNVAIKYIQDYTTVEQKVLILPEGMAINFLANRELDYKLPMADRLYYEAVGKDEIISGLEKTDYEIIILAKGFGLTNFGSEYLYNDNNPVLKYIQAKYKLDWVAKVGENSLTCYAKSY